MHILMSSKICHVRLYHIFQDIALDLVSYINIPTFYSKSWHIKREGNLIFKSMNIPVIISKHLEISGII